VLAFSAAPKYPGACTLDLDLPTSVFLATPLTGDILSGDLSSDLEPDLGIARILTESLTCTFVRDD
jgi:hypothetical protein